MTPRARFHTALGFCFCLCLLALPTVAGVIDTLPGNGDLATAGALTQGGTFVADDEFLSEFTLGIHWMADVRTARPVVLATDSNGMPQSTPILWEGPDITTPFYGTMTFTPNLPLTIGTHYFIGLDYGGVTSVNGDIVMVGSSSQDPIPDGQAWRLFSTGWEMFSPGVDIAARIVMTPMPLVAVESHTISWVKDRYRTDNN